jgi:hypothetical protein
MLYNTQNYWVFRLCALSGIKKTREHNILETEFVSVLRWWRLAISKGPNWVGVFPPHLRTETDPVSDTSYFLVFRILDNGHLHGEVWKPSNSECLLIVSLCKILPAENTVSTSVLVFLLNYLIVYEFKSFWWKNIQWYPEQLCLHKEPLSD